MITIMHLFPNKMNLYGEYANIAVLRRRLTEAGEQVCVRPIPFGEELNLTECDFLYIGGGVDSAMLDVLRELRKNTGMIESFVRFGGVVLATGNAAALFGSSIVIYGEQTQGLGIADYTATLNHLRRYAEYIMSTELVEAAVLGSINTSLEITESSQPMFRIISTNDKDKSRSAEGFMTDGIYATSLIGPLLVRNPVLLDWFAQKLCKRELAQSDSPWMGYARRGYEQLLTTLQHSLGEKG